MYRALVGIGLICALVIVTVFEVTLPSININKQRALENAIFKVLPEANSFSAYSLDNNDNFKKAAADNTLAIYACFDAEKTLIGFAIPAQGMGYQDTIGLLYGYSTLRQTIEGLVILQSRETPGLGSKIESTAFLQNFNGIQVNLNPGDELIHPLELAKTTKKTDVWQIDAVTGATISSQAVVDTMNRSLAFWMPLIAKQKEQINIEH